MGGTDFVQWILLASLFLLMANMLLITVVCSIGLVKAILFKPKRKQETRHE